MKNKGPARKGENRSCLSCGSVFYVKPSWVKLENRGKYCSNNCQHAYMKANGIKPKSPPRKEKLCKQCENAIEAKGKIYCSDLCKQKYNHTRPTRESGFSTQRKLEKLKGSFVFKWREPCITCHKVNQIYYTSTTAKKCKNCHNQAVISNKRKNYKEWRNYYNNWRNKKRQEDPDFKIHCNIRSRISSAIKKIKTYRTGSIESMFGCSKSHLILHLESKFTPKMTWENYGSYWHVDHIMPISSFDLTDPEQCKQANHWANLQPLEALANIAKSNKLTHPQMSLMLNL